MRTRPAALLARLLPLVAPLLAAGPVGAQGMVVSQKSTFNIARIGNGDLQQTVSILGTDRQKTVTQGRMKFLVFSQDASGTEIVRLDRDRAYVRSGKATKFEEREFAAMRREMEENQKRAAAAAPESQESSDVRLYVVSDGLKRTGEKRTINGFSTEQQLFRATVMAENTRTGEKAPMLYLTADVWTDPSHAKEARLQQAFVTEYAKHMGYEPALTANPYARWLRTMKEGVAAVPGYAILSTFTVESEASKDPEQRDAQQAASEAAQKVGKAMGGLMKRVRKKEDAPAEAPAQSAAPGAAPGRTLLFRMTTEVTSISATPPAASEFEPTAS